METIVNLYFQNYNYNGFTYKHSRPVIIRGSVGRTFANGENVFMNALNNVYSYVHYEYLQYMLTKQSNCFWSENNNQGETKQEGCS